MRLLLAATSIVTAAGLWIVAATAPRDAAAVSDAATSSQSVAQPSQVVGITASGQLQFVPNRGQWQEQVRYGVLGDTAGWLHDDGFTVRLERWSAEDASSPHRGCVGGVVRTRFVGAATNRFDRGASFATRHHFLLGDTSRWQRDVPAFEAVTARGVLPGIDVHFRALRGGAQAGGAFEYDLLLAPGADLERFVAECEGVERLRIDEHGQLVATVETPAGTFELVQATPVAWQEAPSGRRPLEVAFRLLGTTRYGFTVAGRDPALASVVDPGVVWGSHLGGGATQRINDVQWVPGDGVYVAGFAGSMDFPTTPGAFATTGGNDAFVAKLSDDGAQLQYATYLGGSQTDAVRGLAVTPAGSAVVVGYTNSDDFPTTASAFQPTYGGGDAFLNIGDAFVARLTADGSALTGATYLGGTFDDIAEDVVIDELGNAFLVGWTSSNDFPVTPETVQPGLGGFAIVQSDGFVACVDATASALTWGTYHGGDASEQFLSIDRDPVSGDVLVGGWTYSSAYPTTINALNGSTQGSVEGVLTCLTGDGTARVLSTYLGGVGEDTVMDAVFAPDGTIWLCGSTSSENFPVTLGVPQQTFGGAVDGYLAQLNASGTQMLYSTFVGGPSQERARGLDLSAAGIMVVGEAGVGFPVTADAQQTQFGEGVLDAFASFYSLDGSEQKWASYFGGSGQEAFRRVQFEDSGLAVFAGWTFSTDFPIEPGAYQPQANGVEDGVVVMYDTVGSLGEGVEITSLSLPNVEIVESGEVELLRVQVANTTLRDVTLDGLDMLVDGASLTLANVVNLRVLRDGAVVAGPLQPNVGVLTDISFNGLVLPAESTSELVVLANVLPSTMGRTIEVAASVIDAGAWRVRAEGAGSGPEVRVMAPGRAVGPVFVLGALPGDFDSDGERTVLDVRSLASRVGAADVVVDVDGDGLITSVDVESCSRAVLGRGSVLDPPEVVARNSWLTLRALLPDISSVQVSLGGRSLLSGRATPRQLSVFVGADQPAGLQELVITSAGRVLFQGFVELL